MIKSLAARLIPDSRGNPTVEVNLVTDKESFFASAPSGASKGRHEAVSLPAKKAVDNINKIIARVLLGKDPAEQKRIDSLLSKKFGANATSAVSMAVAKAGAASQNLPLYKHLNNILNTIVSRVLHLPRPCFNVINGGVHADNGLDIQEFMIVPREKNFRENFEVGRRISRKLIALARKKFGKVKIGDEGGIAPPIKSSETALDLIMEASRGYKIDIILDCAASQFYKKGSYFLEGRRFNKKSLLNYYLELLSKYPIIGFEDPFSEDDWQSWQKFLNLKSKTSNFLVIGDDLTVTNPTRIKLASERKACNAIIVKINQIGTVTKAIEAVRLAKSYGWKVVVSHRSGETMDDFIADFAVGVGADFIKSGAPTRPERLAKYRRLMKIEKDIIYK